MARQFLRELKIPEACVERKDCNIFIMLTTAFLSLILISGVAAQQGAWAQCGGLTWTEGTTCVSGYV